MPHRGTGQRLSSWMHYNRKLLTTKFYEYEKTNYSYRIMPADGVLRTRNGSIRKRFRRW